MKQKKFPPRKTELDLSKKSTIKKIVKEIYEKFPKTMKELSKHD